MQNCSICHNFKFEMRKTAAKTMQKDLGKIKTPQHALEYLNLVQCVCKIRKPFLCISDLLYILEFAKIALHATCFISNTRK